MSTLLRAAVVLGGAVALAVPASVASAEPTPAEITERIRVASAQLGKIVEEYNTVNAALAKTTAAAASAAAQLAPLQGQLDAAHASVAQLAADAYMTGELATVSALLEAGSSGGLLDRLAALDQVARARTQEVSSVATARAKVEESKRGLDALVATQTAQRAELATKKAKIEKDLDTLYDLREQAYGAATETAPATASVAPPYVAGKAGIAVNYAYGALGKPYVWAASGPNGYDCSGLVKAAWGAAGVRLTHAVSVQWTEVAHISRSQLQPGDLVFYSGLGHIAIYVGDGKVIHAPTFGEVVKISGVDMMSIHGYGRPG